ncbi:AAA family ATPase [Aureispira anguillae]|uniref:AAA family ATPase n=1 Tax=Aureispira anguillae TaxID=2864201 RepID=A0A915YDF9_9BACT|nr:AAA family ATPase [Aureispira anguillae]BDS11072.1 AAA family ATPase [Aureispira anguillae]
MNSITNLLKAYSNNQKAQDAIRLIEHTSSSVFLTGKAGTGKSTLLNVLTKSLTKKHIVLAPTELAALQVGGENIHSFFGFEWRAYLPDDKGIPPLPPTTIQLLDEIELIIIDEISMVRCDLMNAIDLALRANLRSNLPFGGKQLMMIGDLYQLPPIIDERDKEAVSLLRTNYTSRYFFSAKAFEGDFKYQIVELSKVYRQRDKKFISLLNAIRVNQLDRNHLELLNERFGVKGGLSTNFKITLASTNAVIKQLNEENLAAIDAPLVTFHADEAGNFANVGSAYPTDKELSIKVGAQVMFVKDDEEGRWTNGTIGRVAEIFEDQVLVEIKVAKTMEVVAVKQYTWHKYIYEWNHETETVEHKTVGSFTQLPIKLAWGITIHKSQGQTFDHVIINLGRKAFATGQTYVALSRCTSFKGITLKRPIHPEDIFVDKRITRFLEAQKQYRADKNSYMTMLEHTERSIQQQHLIISSLEATAVGQQRETKKLVQTLVDQSKKIDWLSTDLEAAKNNLKENETKLGQALSDLAEHEQELANAVGSKGIYQIALVVLAIICLYLLFS